MEEVTLLAMAPAGDVLVIRDRFGRVWVHPPMGAGAPRVVDPEVADRAIARHGFDRVDRNFPGWAELMAFVDERVGKLPPVPVVDMDAFDEVDVREFLDVAREWAQSGDVERARKLVERLLPVPVVHAAGLVDELLSFLDALQAPPRRFESEPRSEYHARARRRWDEINERIAA